MNAEILCVGTELLHGDIVNTNAQYISKKLAEIAIDVHYQTVVGDNPDRIKKCFGIGFSRADIVICTGGLGPTQDDITKEALAEYFNIEMVYDENSFQHVKEMYSRFRKDFPKNNIRQAYFPEGSIILDNPNGTANACIYNGEDSKGNIKIGILLPGPPKEMGPLVDNEVVPYLKQFSDQVVYGEKLVVVNIGESAAEEMILDIIEKQTNPTIAPYASAGKVIFRITAKAESKEKCIEMIQPVKEELINRFGKSNAYVTETGKVEDKTAELLMEKNITIAVAESCTGGLVASRLIGYPGISKVFREGFITYSNEAKMHTLQVNRETLEKFGAVSEETAKEMAYGAAKIAGTDIGVSTTGVAGPGGGTEEKPVGLVYVCVYYKDKFNVLKIQATGSREIVRERASTSVLDLIRSSIENN
ncbi:MAG: competence/damage-inducible protein A [Sedimentibacter sp.]|uniref:competence/damage-inducible protein A n=1 Tax=Sedimentibacter sp. TaxID=1960295 RepID=UPI0029827995|nr:competence/damage-inducible protein A [Sedimentibacter sp.]MDW5299412.1 competence/damage-inducible protein A [Sedimentibacter sp.]